MDDVLESIEGVVLRRFSADDGDVTPKVGDTTLFVSNAPPNSTDALRESDVGSMRCACACMRRGALTGCDGVFIVGSVERSVSSPSARASSAVCRIVFSARSTLGHTIST